MFVFYGFQTTQMSVKHHLIKTNQNVWESIKIYEVNQDLALTLFRTLFQQVPVQWHLRKSSGGVLQAPHSIKTKLIQPPSFELCRWSARSVTALNQPTAGRATARGKAVGKCRLSVAAGRDP